MTITELKEVFLWYETHSYLASRPNLESKFEYTLRELPLSKGSLEYKKWHANMMAEFYCDLDYVGGEPDGNS